MSVKRFTYEWKRCYRPGGGMFIGVKFHFPMSIWDGDCGYTDYKPTNTRYKLIWFFFGFGLWTLDLQYKYNIKPIKE